MKLDELNEYFENVRLAEKKYRDAQNQLQKACYNLIKTLKLPYVVGKIYCREVEHGWGDKAKTIVQRIKITSVKINPQWDTFRGKPVNEVDLTYYGNIIRKDGTEGRRKEIYSWEEWKESE